MNTREKHRLAMEKVDFARIALRQEDKQKALTLFKEAYALEEEILSTASGDLTLTILGRSLTELSAIIKGLEA